MFLVWSPDRTERPFSSNENAYGEIIVYICRLFRVTRRPQAENLYCTIGYTHKWFSYAPVGWRGGTNSFWILQLRPHAAAVEWSTKRLNFYLANFTKWNNYFMKTWVRVQTHQRGGSQVFSLQNFGWASRISKELHLAILAWKYDWRKVTGTLMR